MTCVCGHPQADHSGQSSRGSCQTCYDASDHGLKPYCPRFRLPPLRTSLFLQHESGAMHEFTGRRLKRLQREILAGRGGPEVTTLVASGYNGFLARSGEVHDFEDLVNEFTPSVNVNSQAPSAGE